MLSQIKMCRLFAMIGDAPLPVSGAIEPFTALCKKGAVLPCATPGHEDGWGFSGFSKGRAVYFDRQMKALEATPERLPAVIQRIVSIESPLVVGHLRKGATHLVEMGDVQPFHYRDWVFAHNGNIFDAQKLDIADYQTQGRTDSERFLVWLVDQVGVAIDPTEALAEILSTVREKLHFNSLTFLLSEGTTLWAYREISKEALEKGVTLADRQNYFTLFMGKVGETAVLCSEAIPEIKVGWKLLPERTLATYKIGRADPILRSL